MDAASKIRRSGDGQLATWKWSGRAVELKEQSGPLQLSRGLLSFGPRKWHSGGLMQEPAAQRGTPVRHS